MLGNDCYLKSKSKVNGPKKKPNSHANAVKEFMAQSKVNGTPVTLGQASKIVSEYNKMKQDGGGWESIKRHFKYRGSDTNHYMPLPEYDQLNKKINNIPEPLSTKLKPQRKPLSDNQKRANLINRQNRSPYQAEKRRLQNLTLEDKYPNF